MHVRCERVHLHAKRVGVPADPSARGPALAVVSPPDPAQKLWRRGGRPRAREGA